MVANCEDLCRQGCEAAQSDRISSFIISTVTMEAAEPLEAWTKSTKLHDFTSKETETLKVTN